MTAGPGEVGADPRVAAALDRLDELDSLPTAEHVEVYADVHRRLEAALTDPLGGVGPSGQPEDEPATGDSAAGEAGPAG